MQEYKERHGTLILAIPPEVGHFRPDNWWWRSLGVRLLGGAFINRFNTTEAIAFGVIEAGFTSIVK
jgi:hypothetical protein